MGSEKRSKKEILKALSNLDWEFFECRNKRQWKLLCTKLRDLVNEWGDDENDKTVFIRTRDNKEFVLYGGLKGTVLLHSTQEGEDPIAISRGYLYSRHFKLKEE